MLNFFYLIILFPVLIIAQKITISGEVGDAEHTLPGADILVKGTNNGTTTDDQGKYSLRANSNDILVFSYPGFSTKEVAINGQAIINVKLENVAEISQVTVQGFANIKGRARKRLESIQTVPESITAVTSEDIELTSIKDIGSLLTQIPGVSYGESQDPGTVFISVRGIPQIRYGPSPIATVVDGIYLASPDLNNQSLFDIEQIEVIKGSQGLFYGKNAIGGAIVITTKQPSNDMEGNVKVGYANGNTSSAQANVGGSIINNKLYYRLATSYLNSDGLIENTTLNKKVDFRKELGFRGLLKFKLDSKSTLSFTGQHGNKKGGAVTFVSSASNDDFPGNSPNVYKGNPKADFLGQGEVKSTLGSVSFETNFPWARLASYTSYADVNLFYDGDYFFYDPDSGLADNYGPKPIIFQTMLRASKTFNQELRLVSTKSKSKFRWNLGTFFQNIDSDWDTKAFKNNNVKDFTYKNTTEDVISNDDNTLRSLGLFGFFEYDLTKKLNISIGLRNEWEALKNTEGVSKIVSKINYNAFQPKVSMSYHFIKDKMLYASYSRGFRSGGYNPEAILNRGIKKIIKPEFTNNFELGAKNSFWNNRFILNLAYFYTIFKDQQIFRFASTGKRNVLGTINYKESKVSGIEVDTKLRLTKNFDFIGGFSIIDSKITKAFEKSSEGNKIPFAPQSSFNMGLIANFDLGKHSKLLANVNIENKGKKYWFADNLYGIDQEKISQDPFTLVNAKVIVSLNKFRIGLWGKNIFDTKYNEEWWPFGVFDGNPVAGPTGDIRTPSRPATFGVELSYKF